MREGPRTSTPGSDIDAIHHLTDMVGQLGAQIGESIVAKLMSAGVVNMNSDHQSASTAQNTHCDVNRHDLPCVTVRVNSDKVLQTFRGDSTDKYPVQDWIDSTKTHLRKQEIPVRHYEPLNGQGKRCCKDCLAVMRPHVSLSQTSMLLCPSTGRELRASGRTTGAAQLKSHITTVTPEQPSPPSSGLAASEQCHTQGPSPSSLQAQHRHLSQFKVNLNGLQAMPLYQLWHKISNSRGETSHSYG
ncbi:hypothetical protein N1851_027071 [Merluccius polli]|uniref:Uncharacterized protein n=1 Tax=Merluccius polli TaxID=89951 RepID=A0AA47MB12_MERPO|nr:hypothetical protein N1851_027071 [Merluccius polli]